MAKRIKKTLADLAPVAPETIEGFVDGLEATVGLMLADFENKVKFHNAAFAALEELHLCVNEKRTMERELDTRFPVLAGYRAHALSLKSALADPRILGNAKVRGLPANHPWWVEYQALTKAIGDIQNAYFHDVEVRISDIETLMEERGYAEHIRSCGK